MSLRDVVPAGQEIVMRADDFIVFVQLGRLNASRNRKI
jgi:hypothetical protein